MFPARVKSAEMMVAKVSRNRVQRAQPAGLRPAAPKCQVGFGSLTLTVNERLPTLPDILEHFPRSWSCGSCSFVIRSRREHSKRFKVHVALFREIRSKHSRPSSAPGVRLMFAKTWRGNGPMVKYDVFYHTGSNLKGGSALCTRCKGPIHPSGYFPCDRTRRTWRLPLRNLYEHGISLRKLLPEKRALRLREHQTYSKARY